MVIELLLVLASSVGVFLLGLYFIRNPDRPTQFFTLGRFPHSPSGLWWSRFAGYIFCVASVAFWILTPLYLIVHLYENP